MKIIIKDRKMNLKVKTDNIALAQTILGFIRSQVNSTSAKTAFRVGMLAGNLMSDLKSQIDSKEDGEKGIDQQALKPGRKSGRPKGVKNKHRKFAQVEWTDKEILFLKDSNNKKAKFVITAPELARHSKAAILSKRYAVKNKVARNLSKRHFTLIK
jgi:hypothetical protein